MRAKLLLVEDDRSLGETLQERLEKEGYEVLWTVSAVSAKKIGQGRKTSSDSFRCTFTGWRWFRSCRRAERK